MKKISIMVVIALLIGLITGCRNDVGQPMLCGFSDIITMTDDMQYALFCTVDVMCLNTVGKYNKVKGDRLQFVIQL